MKMLEERDIDNLAAILDHCDRIEATFARIKRSYATFQNDADYRDAILMNIVQIGEAANRLSETCREELNELPWSSIIGTRNIIVHGYLQIENRLIWKIITDDIPALKNAIEEYL